MKKTILITIILISSALICSCNDSHKPFQKSGVYFDTIVTVSVYSGSKETAEALLNECMDICEHYENMFDEKIPSSDIHKINTSAGSPVKVSSDTISLIETSVGYSILTDGLFDITIDPVSDLWDFHEGGGSIPDATELAEAAALVDYRNISIDKAGNTITLSKGSIDPGAAAKGYIADIIADHLAGEPIDGAVINIGGDLRLIGSKQDGSMFNIGINDPFTENGIILDLYTTDRAVATSGIYERCFTKDGKIYHHILDASTGYPVDTDIESVTVITQTATDADCLCTVLLILGSDKGMELIERTPNTEAIFVLTDGSVLSTSGADSFIRH